MDVDVDVVVVGAGPYGLSAAAHLGAEGAETRVFGSPMSFWEDCMPRGMLLRSRWPACTISAPTPGLSLEDYQRTVAPSLGSPVPLAAFVEYGRWFQKNAVPHTEDRQVQSVSAPGDGRGPFEVVLEDGERLSAERVVLATGIDGYAHVPPVFSGLPSELVSHTREHTDLSTFAGRRVAVVGAGQSALESAALLHEGGADVEVLSRSSQLHYLSGGRLHKLGPITTMLYAPTDVGPAGISRLVAAPELFRRLPRRTQDRVAKRAIRPAGAAWLRPRLTAVPIRTGVEVVGAQEKGGQVVLRLSDGSTRQVDHVLCATGYRVDVRRSTVLDAALVGRLSCAGGFPRLSAGLESSVPGLHFVGAPAAWSMGPVTRFVAGTDSVSRALVSNLRRSRTAKGRATA